MPAEARSSPAASGGPNSRRSTSYDRTLRSEFEGFGGFASDSATPSNEESAEIPFGSAHTYRAGLTASYTVFSGGRGLAQSRAAASTRRAADLGFTSSVAQLRLDVPRRITRRCSRTSCTASRSGRSSRQRARTAGSPSSAGAGRAPEFDLVRAKAARDRQRPVVIQREAERDDRHAASCASCCTFRPTCRADTSVATLPAPIAFDNRSRRGRALRVERAGPPCVRQPSRLLAASRCWRRRSRGDYRPSRSLRRTSVSRIR